MRRTREGNRGKREREGNRGGREREGKGGVHERLRIEMIWKGREGIRRES